MKSRIIGIAIAIFCLIILLFGVIVRLRDIYIIGDYPRMSSNSIITIYNDNKNIFSEISKYAKGINEDITIDTDKRNKFIISKLEEVKVVKLKADNRRLSDNIIALFYKLRIEHVVEEGNAVYFLKHTAIGFEQGIVCSKDDKKPNWPLITKLEHIKGNWYYYESK